MFDAAADEGDVLHFALNLLMVPDTMPSDKASPAPQNIAVGGTVTHEDTDSDDDKVTIVLPRRRSYLHPTEPRSEALSRSARDSFYRVGFSMGPYIGDTVLKWPAWLAARATSFLGWCGFQAGKLLSVVGE